MPARSPPQMHFPEVALMEKLFYTLWKDPGENAAAWRDRLRGSLGRELVANGALSLQVDIVDEGVADGTALRLTSRPAPDGFVAFWMNSANYRRDCERLLRTTHQTIAGYLVTESCIKDDPSRSAAAERSFGFSLIGFLRRPPRLTERQWLEIWLGSHTRVAVETQSTFRYIQNVVVRELTEDAPMLDAIVEEGFPPSALSDPAAFYDAVGDSEKFERNHRRMMDSCNRFIDFDRLDSLPMSEYRIAGPQRTA
jgi:hypothetical protein